MNKEDKKTWIEFESKYNVGIVERNVHGKFEYHIHGHASTKSDSPIEAINKYLK